MYELKHIVDYIFRDKQNYNKLTVDDKKKFFFIINRKFAREYPRHAQHLNIKNIDESSALDVWYYFFIKKRVINTPDWYWFKLSTKREKTTKYKNDEIEFIKNYYDIDDHGIDYLIKNHQNELEEEIKKYRKFNKNGT